MVDTRRSRIESIARSSHAKPNPSANCNPCPSSPIDIYLVHDTTYLAIHCLHCNGNAGRKKGERRVDHGRITLSCAVWVPCSVGSSFPCPLLGVDITGRDIDGSMGHLDGPGGLLNGLWTYFVPLPRSGNTGTELSSSRGESRLIDAINPSVGTGSPPAATPPPPCHRSIVHFQPALPPSSQLPRPPRNFPCTPPLPFPMERDDGGGGPG